MNSSLTLNKLVHFTFPLLVIGIISRTFPSLSIFYYIVPAFLITYSILILKQILFDQNSISKCIILKNSHTLVIILFAFPVYCLLTSLWSHYPIVSMQRSLYLMLLYAGIFAGVFLFLQTSKESLLNSLVLIFLPANILVVLLSLFSLIFNIPDNSWIGGHGLGFMGFAGHQNTLASALLFTLPGVFALGIEQSTRRKENSKKYYLVFASIFLLLTFNFSLLVITYSRATILSLLVGLTIFLLLMKSYKFLILFSAFTILILTAFFTIQPVNQSLYKLISKDGGDVLGRRMILWEPSFEAAKIGGIFGLGYGISASDIKTPELTGSHFEEGRYIREKGNSVLAMIEETGFVGLILFLLPVLMIIKKFKVHNSKFKINYSFLILNSTLIALFIHAQFESWWVGVGSISLPLFLIILFALIISEKNYDGISNLPLPAGRRCERS